MSDCLPKSNSKTTRASRIKSASVKRREENKAALKQMILDAAIELFEEQGYEHFSLRQVAEAIGYSATTIYLYFKNKDDLLLQAAMQGFKRFGEMLQEGYESATSPRERFKHVGRAYIAFGVNYPVHYRLMFMQRGEFLYATAPDDDAETLIDAFGVLKKSLVECIDAGLMYSDKVEDYANLAWATVHGIVALNISIPHITEEDLQKMQMQFEKFSDTGFFKEGAS